MKKSFIFSSLFVVAVFVFCLMVTNNVEAAGEVNISNCSMNTSDGRTTIFTPGEYWLNQSIIANESGTGSPTKACLFVNGSNILLDCRGNTITGINNVTGIFTNGTNVTIRNCFIINFTDAINLSSTLTATIWNNTIENISNIVINSVNSNTSNISANTITNCTVGGINMTASFTNTIELNTFYTTGTTINSIGGTNNNILSNTLNNGTKGIDLWNEITVTILSNIIGNYSSIGIQSLNSNGTNITSNTIKNITTTGIFINFSFSNDIASNIVYNATTAIYSDNSDDGFFTSNTLRNGTTGLFLFRSENMTLTSNTARKFYFVGQRFSTAINNTFNSGTANNNDFGIYIDTGSEDNTFNSGTTNNNNYGFFIGTDSDRNTFTNGVANYNVLYGLLINDSASGNNTFTGFNLSNPLPTARDININANDNKFYTMAVSYINATDDILRTVFSFDNYNGTQMNISAVEDVLVVADPTARQNISKYLNITRRAGDWMVINMSYTAADLIMSTYVSVSPSTLKIWNSSDSTSWGLVSSSNPFTASNFISANLTVFSEFGLFGQTVTANRYSGGSSSGGGAGTGVSLFNFDINPQITKDFRKYDMFQFSRKDIDHRMTMLNLDTVAEEVRVRVESTPREYTIKLKQTVEIDTNGNGYNDLSLTLDELDSVTATLVIKRVDEVIPTRPAITPTPELKKERAPEPLTKEPVREFIPAPVEEKLGGFWIFAGVIAGLIVIWIIIVMAKKKKTAFKRRR